MKKVDRFLLRTTNPFSLLASNILNCDTEQETSNANSDRTSNELVWKIVESIINNMRLKCLLRSTYS